MRVVAIDTEDLTHGEERAVTPRWIFGTGMRRGLVEMRWGIAVCPIQVKIRNNDESIQTARESPDETEKSQASYSMHVTLRHDRSTHLHSC